ncbi:unnamed protein product, partial [Prorocentrum cordatum]
MPAGHLWGPATGPGGKRVTIVAGVCGNARALCTALTTLLGTGGTVHPRGAQRADVEVQGEQVERVGKALSQLGCLRGLAGEKAGGAVALVAERDCGYDEFLRRTEPRSKARHAKAQGPDAKLPEPPEDAPCRKWHGFWLYCTGACEQRPRPAPGPAASGPQRVAAQDGQLVCEEPGGAEGEGMCTHECGATFGQRRTLELHRRQHRAERQQEEAQPRHPPAAAAGAAFAPSGGGDSWRYDGAYNSREAALEEESAWGLLGNTAGAAADDDDGVDAVAATYLANRRDAPSLASFIEASLQPAGVQRRRRAPPQAPLAGTEEVACPVCGGLVAAAEMDRRAPRPVPGDRRLGLRRLGLRPVARARRRRGRGRRGGVAGGAAGELARARPLRGGGAVLLGALRGGGRPGAGAGARGLPLGSGAHARRLRRRRRAGRRRARLGQRPGRAGARRREPAGGPRHVPGLRPSGASRRRGGARGPVPRGRWRPAAHGSAARCRRASGRGARCRGRRCR